MDCHIETFMERAWRKYAGCWRASVVLTETGQVLYVTWPYNSAADARDRARRWIRDEAQRQDAAGKGPCLFG